MTELLNTKSFEEGSIEAQVVAVLKTCYDPEIPVDIFELGLIYSIEMTNESSARICMTLTSPACPVAGTLPPEVQQKIKDEVSDLDTVSVDIVWEPAWTTDMMSEGAKLELGIL